MRSTIKTTRYDTYKSMLFLRNFLAPGRSLGFPLHGIGKNKFYLFEKKVIIKCAFEFFKLNIRPMVEKRYPGVIVSSINLFTNDDYSIHCYLRYLYQYQTINWNRDQFKLRRSSSVRGCWFDLCCVYYTAYGHVPSWVLCVIVYCSASSKWSLRGTIDRNYFNLGSSSVSMKVLAQKLGSMKLVSFW